MLPRFVLSATVVGLVMFVWLFFIVAVCCVGMFACKVLFFTGRQAVTTGCCHVC